MGAAKALSSEAYTILLRHAEKQNEELEALATAFKDNFHTPVNINIYATPPGKHGFSWHYDAEEVFIMQTSGQKAYSLRKNTVNPWPLAEIIPEDMRQPGCLLSVDRARIVDLWQELTAIDIRPGGAEAFHAHRIESGFPLYGLDLTDDNLAQEAARAQRAISYTKGCYLGQEPIARIDALGHVNRELRILKLNSTPAPETGAVIRAKNGQEIGAITSSAMVPGEDRSVALGYVRSSHAKPETAVIVRADDREIPATVFWHEQSTLIR